MNNEEIKKAVLEAVQDGLKDFYVERETHYKHHEFISNVIDTRDKVKSAAIKSTTIGFVGFVLTIIWIGFKDYIKAWFVK